MSIEADIVTYLDGATSLTAGTDLFQGPLPELPADCVAITHTGGEKGEYTMGPSLSSAGIEMGRFQMAVRRTSRATAFSDANTYYALLANLGPVTLASGKVYQDVESLDGEPYNLGQDSLDNWRVVCNFRCWKQRG